MIPFVLAHLNESISIASGTLMGLIAFSYLLLRWIEVKNELLEQYEAPIKADGKTAARKEEIPISFSKIEAAFLQSEVGRPTLGRKANLRIFMQGVSTVAISCHTSAVLPIAFVGILISYVIINSCLWRKQLKYEWMSSLPHYYLRLTLLFISCATTCIITFLVWAFRTGNEEEEGSILGRYERVFFATGVFL